MFRPVTMSRISAVVLERDERAILRELGRLGVLQLTRTPAGTETATMPPRDRGKEMATCDRLLARIEALGQSLELASFAGELKPMEMSLSKAEERLNSIEKQADVLMHRRQLQLQKLSESTAVCERVASYRGLDLPLDSPEQFSFLHFVTGSLPSAAFESVQQQIGDNVALLPLPGQKGRQPLIAMTTRQGWSTLESTLQRAGFQAESLPEVEGATVDSVIEASRREEREVEAKLDELTVELQALAAEWARPLAEIECLVKLERQLLTVELHLSHTESTVLISGWLPADRDSAVKEHLRQMTNGRCVIETAGLPDCSDEPVPVLLRHPRWLRPFEMLVSAYGLPSYHELEPTLFVAVSYVLMFGMMFGDAGHGFVLAVGGSIALLYGRSEKLRDAGVLILFAAGSSIAFGIVYGSCFGLEWFKKYALWHDPIEGDPMALMYGAIGLGVVLISLGLVLNIINRFRRGDVIGGFLDKFGVMGVAFYWGVLALITKYAAIESRGLVNLAIVLFVGLPLLGWGLKEPIEYLAHRRAGQSVAAGGGLFASITESSVGAFEAVLSYLANTISFVRLAAYAMSHAALLVAVFMMADAVRHYSIGGGVLSVLVIILGNLVAIVLEGIIASVQALRLEYYEFFGKFFSGSGQPFRPFRLVANGRTGKGAPA